MLICGYITAMDQAISVYVKTADGVVMQVERWKIDEMKALLILLEHQRGKNNDKNPLQATMINSEELRLLSDAFNNIAQGNDKNFLNGLVESDEQAGNEKSFLGEGKLRTLINAAGQVDAQGLSAFCLSYIMPSDLQKRLLMPDFLESITTMLDIVSLNKPPIALKKASSINNNFFKFSSVDSNKIVTRGSKKHHAVILHDISNQPDITSLELVNKRLDNISSIAFSLDGNKIVLGSYGRRNNLILWNISNPAAITEQVLIGHPKPVQSVALSPDGNTIVSGSEGDQDNLILWDISNPAAITSHVLKGHPNNVTSIEFSSDGSKIVSGGRGNQDNLILWDIGNPHAITHQNLAGHPDRITSVLFSPDGKSIISGSDGNQNNLILWNISNPAAITSHVLEGHPKNVTSVAFNSDGSKIVSGSDGNQDNLILWDISDPAKITSHVLVGHPGPVKSVALSPDDSKIVSGAHCHNNSLLLWDISNPAKITHEVLAKHLNFIGVIAFSSDGSKLAVGLSYKDLVEIYRLLSTQEKEALGKCTIVQLRFIYQLCLASQCGFKVKLHSPYAREIFTTLPQIVRDLIGTTLGIHIPNI
jgi:WD40 repeat protein